jgi:hypothetical protein
VLDKVCFTIDHIHAGNHHTSSTYEVVKYLVDNNIPVTVFIQASNPSNNYEFDRVNARAIYKLAPHLVTLGVHPLHAGHSQHEQQRVHSAISNIIKDVTGKRPTTLSYHGHGAGPEPGIRFSGIKYGRGIGSAWAAGADDPLDTPVMPSQSVDRTFAYTKERNAAGLSATLFLHTQELRHGSTKKRIFDTFVNEVRQQRLQALSYYDAMESDFGGNTSSGGSVTPRPQPQPLRPATPAERTGVVRLSASTQRGRRPVNASFYVQKTNGVHVQSATGLKSEKFLLPVGHYKVTAKARGASSSKLITVSAHQGLHHIFLLPV